MKKIFLLLFAIAFLVSCDEQDSGNVSGITNYAVFEFDPIVAVPLGGSFTPSGIATEGGNEIPVTITGSVDTNTIGVYTFTYSAVNSDGYSASAVQTVVVHDPSIVGTDVSGDYWDKNNHSRTGVISLIPGTTSIFLATDFGFAGAFPVYFQMDGDQISTIYQEYPLDVTSISLDYDPVLREFYVGPIQPYGFSYTFEYQ